MPVSEVMLPRKVIIVDDQPVGLQSLKDFLETQGIQTLIAPDYGSAMYTFNSTSVDVAVVLLELGGMSGLTLIQKFRSNEIIAKRCAGIVVTSKSRTLSLTDENLSKELGGIEILSKPFQPVQLLPFLSRARIRSVKDMKFDEFKQKLVDFYRRTKNIEKAIEALNQKVGDFGNPGQLLMLELLEEASRLEEALTLVRHLLQQKDLIDNIALVNAEARILMKLKRFEEAATSFEKADSLAPKNIARLNQMASLYLTMRKADKSVDKMKGLLELNPENQDLKFDMFAQLQQHGFDEHAIAFCRSTTTPPEIVKHYNNKGVLKSKSGDADGALKEYLDALRFYPEFNQNSRVHFNAALAHVNSRKPGSVAKAIEQLELALKLEPGYDKAQQLLAKLKDLAAAS